MVSLVFCSFALFIQLLVPLIHAAVHENLAATPSGWSQAGTPPQEELMILQVALQQQNLDKLESAIYDVSTPGSSSYGQFMEGEEVSAMIAPVSEAAPAVEAWLKAGGVQDIHTEREYVIFAAPVETANKLLNTQFHYYENEGLTKLRTTGYSVPNDLSQYIDFVHPTTYFGKTTAQVPFPQPHQDKIVLTPRNANSTNGTTNGTAIDASCKDLITPQCIKEIYNIGNYTADPNSGSKIAFGSFLNQSARTQDLILFETKYDIPQEGFSVQLINGGTNDQSVSPNHGEANLDVEYIVGTSHPLPIISYITGGSPYGTVYSLFDAFVKLIPWTGPSYQILTSQTLLSIQTNRT